MYFDNHNNNDGGLTHSSSFNQIIDKAKFQIGDISHSRSQDEDFIGNGFAQSNKLKEELLGSFGVGGGIKKAGQPEFNLEKCLANLYERIIEDEIAQSLKPNGFTPAPDIQQMREFYLERVTEIIKDSFLLEKDGQIEFL